MTKLITWLRTAYRNLGSRFAPRFTTQPDTFTSVLDVPGRLPPRTAVIIAKGRVDRWVLFDCPCPKRHRVMLNIDPSVGYAWRVLNMQPLTLHPSINELTADGRCHYLIRNGKVRWV